MQRRVLTSREELAELQRNSVAFILLGLVAVVVGFLAIGSTFVATLASVKVFGWILIIAGATEVVHALLGRHSRGLAIHLLAAAMYLLVGLFILEDPVQAAAVITLVMAASFLVGGVLRAIFSIAVRFPSWPWVFLNGIVDIVLGVMIWNRWPESSLWVIGLFVGIDLIFHGWSWIILAMSVRSIRPPAAA